jgi:hypothetical protein
MVGSQSRSTNSSGDERNCLHLELRPQTASLPACGLETKRPISTVPLDVQSEVMFIQQIAAEEERFSCGLQQTPAPLCIVTLQPD